MEESKGMLPDTDQLDQQEGEKLKIHLFSTSAELTYLTDAEYKRRTQPDEQIIQSSSLEQEQDYLSQQPTIPLVPGNQRVSKSWPLVPWVVLCMNMALCLALFFLDMLPSLTDRATITLVPKQAAIATVASVPLQPRVLTPLVLTQKKTVPATQHIHRDAAVATGELTFYNALQQPQYIAAGALITTRSGVNIVTTQDATIPAGDGVTNGSASVAAQATDPGPQGNIPASTLNGTCCREYILVKNLSSFLGGRNARDFMVVSEKDIEPPITAMQTALTQNMYLQFQRETQKAERLVQPLPCTRSVTTTHAIGDEATSVTVRLTLSCSGLAYNPYTLQQQATRVLAQFALRKLGKGYQLVNTLKSDIIHITVTPMHVIFLTHLTGRYAYMLNVGKIKQEIAGKPKAKALYLLSHHQGILHVFMYTTSNALPTEQSHIVISLVFYPS